MGKTEIKECLLDVAAHFGKVNFSVGPENGSVAVKIARDEMTLEEAEANFCGRSIKATLLILPTGEDRDQRELLDTGTRTQIDVEASVKRFITSIKFFTLGLTFPLDGATVERFKPIVNRNGRLTVHEVRELAEEEAGEEGPEAESEN